MVIIISQMYKNEEICRFHVVIGASSAGICIIETIKENAKYYERLLPNSQCISMKRLIYTLKPKLSHNSYPDGYTYSDETWLEALSLSHGVSKNSKIWFRFKGEESLTFEDVTSSKSLDAVYLGDNHLGYVLSSEGRNVFIQPEVVLKETGRIDVKPEDMFKEIHVDV